MVEDTDIEPVLREELVITTLGILIPSLINIFEIPSFLISGGTEETKTS